jgi:hypothetical protein
MGAVITGALGRMRCAVVDLAFGTIRGPVAFYCKELVLVATIRGGFSLLRLGGISAEQ